LAGRGGFAVEVQTQEKLDGLTLLEERVHRAVALIRSLKTEKQELQEAVEAMRDEHQKVESRLEALTREKEELQRQGQVHREKEANWGQYQKDREDIRVRIDSMLAKFEELEI
jgi:FtsZ-binding cell division protein ZapB